MDGLAHSQHQCAAERAHSGAAHQQPQRFGAAVQNLVGKDRHEDRIRHGGEAYQREQKHQRAYWPGSGYEAEAFNYVLEWRAFNAAARPFHRHQ
jgi:hypothetical protein